MTCRICSGNHLRDLASIYAAEALSDERDRLAVFACEVANSHDEAFHEDAARTQVATEAPGDRVVTEVVEPTSQHGGGLTVGHEPRQKVDGMTVAARHAAKERHAWKQCRRLE